MGPRSAAVRCLPGFLKSLGLTGVLLNSSFLTCSTRKGRTNHPRAFHFRSISAIAASRVEIETLGPGRLVQELAQNSRPRGSRCDPRSTCSCTSPHVEKYLSKTFSPLLDRIELHVEVPAVPFTQLAEMHPRTDLRLPARPSARVPSSTGHAIRNQVHASQRSHDPTAGEEVLRALTRSDVPLEGRHQRSAPPSVRAHDKVLRGARAIADREGHDDIKPHNIAEAVGDRSLDRSVWA
jgi:magnesium chelatase family protein